MENYERKLDAEVTRWCRVHSDPIFIGDYFLADGNSEKTANATATFVRFGGRHYAITCAHVLDIADDKRAQSAYGRETLRLMAGKAALNFSSFGPDGQRSSFIRLDEDGYALDLGIAAIDGYWALLCGEKQKEAIDLDEWQEPPWEKIELGAAAGYATLRKRRSGKMVETDMPVAYADLHTPLGPDTREFTLHSTLEEPHGVYFSGMSGGPIVGCWDDRFLPIGIVFEGEPSSPREGESLFAGANDILIRGLLLTPSRFERWLDRAQLQ